MSHEERNGLTEKKIHTKRKSFMVKENVSRQKKMSDWERKSFKAKENVSQGRKKPHGNRKCLTPKENVSQQNKENFKNNNDLKNHLYSSFSMEIVLHYY